MSLEANIIFWALCSHQETGSSVRTILESQTPSFPAILEEGGQAFLKGLLADWQFSGTSALWRVSLKAASLGGYTSMKTSEQTAGPPSTPFLERKLGHRFCWLYFLLVSSPGAVDFGPLWPVYLPFTKSHGNLHIQLSASKGKGNPCSRAENAQRVGTPGKGRLSSQVSQGTFHQNQ